MGDESVTMTWVSGGNKKKRFWKGIAFVYNLITGSLDKTSQKKKKAIATPDWLSVAILSA